VALDIIVVNYNSGDYILSCLGSLDQQDDANDYRVTVFDNASVDASLTRARRIYPDADFESSPVNLGFARAVNSVLKRTDAPYVLLVNPDVIVLPGTIARMRAFMEKNGSCGILGGEILNANGITQPTCRRFPTYYNVVFGRRSIFRRLIPGNPGSRRYLYLDQDRSKPQKVDFLEGSLMMIRRRALVETGFLDEGFFLYMEDADLCLRMALRGWETWWLPRAYAIHFRGENIRSDNIHPMRHHSQGIYKFFLKHRRPGALPRAFLKLSLSLRLGYILGTEFAKKGMT
jgi:N-acetylglucosaminyl-diphospho-decaprenol L-rhamnosyltransferase